MRHDTRSEWTIHLCVCKPREVRSDFREFSQSKFQVFLRKWLDYKIIIQILKEKHDIKKHFFHRGQFIRLCTIMCAFLLATNAVRWRRNHYIDQGCKGNTERYSVWYAGRRTYFTASENKCCISWPNSKCFAESYLGRVITNSNKSRSRTFSYRTPPFSKLISFTNCLKSFRSWSIIDILFWQPKTKQNAVIIESANALLILRTAIGVWCDRNTDGLSSSSPCQMTLLIMDSCYRN